MNTAETTSRPAVTRRPVGDDLSIELVPYWDDACRAIVRRNGRTVFACTATQQASSAWIVTECLPQRRDPESATLLLAVCETLATEYDVAATIAIHPAFLAAELGAAGADPMQRLVPMWMPLDEDLLLLHSRPLPRDYQLVPLNTVADTPEALAGLSPEADRDRDLQTWQETLSGSCGPLVPEASLEVVKDSRLHAAVAITDYHGTPLIAHIVTAATERGTGLGRAVLVEGLRGLLSAGYTDCRLNVLEDNWIARRLYRSVGFIQDRQTLQVSVVRGLATDVD